jgi:hypothetical protein
MYGTKSAALSLTAPMTSKMEATRQKTLATIDEMNMPLASRISLVEFSYNFQ